MKPSCFGKLERIKECDHEKCPVKRLCLSHVLEKLVSKGLLEENYIDGELGYRPTKKGIEREELVQAVWK